MIIEFTADAYQDLQDSARREHLNLSTIANRAATVYQVLTAAQASGAQIKTHWPDGRVEQFVIITSSEGEL